MFRLYEDRMNDVPETGEHMGSDADAAVTIVTSAQSVPSTPSWFGEVTVIAQYLRHLGVLSGISERVRFARVRHEAA